MSILISGVQMPENCNKCPCYWNWEYYQECQVLRKKISLSGRREDCTLVEIPEHNGRLVDLDKLIDDMGLDKAQKYGNETAADRSFIYGTLMRYEIADALEDAPVIIDKE